MTVQADPLRARGSEVAALSDALARGGGALDMVPTMLEELLDSGAWQHFVTRLGKEVHHERFDEFAATPPLGGLGASPDLIDRIVKDLPDVQIKLRAARRGKRGRKPKGETPNPLESKAIGWGTADHDAERLARDAPDEYAAVKAGQKSINAAAVSAGIRPHRVPVRLDRMESIAATLRKYLTPDQRQALARLLTEE